MKLWELLPEFTKALEEQLKQDEKKWGDTWQKRKKEGQEQRTKAVFDNYFDQYFNAGVPVPWLKIAGNALICWARDKGLV